jgi:hypothetical protein
MDLKIAFCCKALQRYKEKVELPKAIPLFC